ncbi:ATP-binding protein [uncultured Bacteroides sp.]|uniref:AAA family ATPase n=1 Tax=uncultured Bacteroides sp. TaxID=162156 RepID=UPI002AA6BD86|nr:ATP-binding protein [uncultured Bacteroides sp.]
MLINFTVGNYCSFKEKKTLSMEATAIKELKESIIVKGDHRLLPSAVIYGANSSGKSNLLKAIDKFTTLVSSSSRSISTDKLNLVPFLLNTETEKEPSFFEVELLINNTVYRYGFMADNERIHEEWLYKTKKKKEICLFIRTIEGIGVTEDFPKGKGVEEKTRDNALFLSMVNSLNGGIAKKIVQQISSLWVISGINRSLWSNVTNIACNADKLFLKAAKTFFRTMNMGFDDFEISEDPDIMKVVKAYTLHHQYDNEGRITGEKRFTMQECESSGTNKLFELAALLIMSLKQGSILVIDELDSQLHPILTQHIIDMFNDPEQNQNGAQLIFATHNTNLLNIKAFRRDQIWFTEKDETEATDLYSLVELKEPDGTKIRNDRSFEKDYINGRYGAIPYIKNKSWDNSEV